MPGKLLKKSAAVALMLLISAILISACSEPQTDTKIIEVSNPTNAPRISVQRIAVLEDSVAYGDRRGVYLIRDTKTGKEYFGVSGIGITKLGAHSAGKSIAEDER